MGGGGGGAAGDPISSGDAISDIEQAVSFLRCYVSVDVKVEKACVCVGGGGEGVCTAACTSIYMNEYGEVNSRRRRRRRAAAWAVWFSMLMLLAKKKRRRRKQREKNLPTQKGKESAVPPTSSSSSSYNRCHKTLPHICLFPPQLTGSKMKRLHVCCSICFFSFSFF